MNYYSIFFTFLVLSFHSLSAQYNCSEPIEIISLQRTDEKRFDLSGIAEVDGKIYVVADKEWNKYIYEISKKGKNWFIHEAYPIKMEGDFDFEGLDFGDGEFYLCDEKNSKVFKLNPTTQKVEEFNFSWGKFNDGAWGNKGLEGIAINPQEQIIYLAKERGPRNIYGVALNSGKVCEPFKMLLGNNEPPGSDIADLKFKDGILYILARGQFKVIKLDVEAYKSNPVPINELPYFSYREVAFNAMQKLYLDNDFPMAEALLITDQEIWIGIDNNGGRLNPDNKWVKKEKLSGTQPIILRLSRNGF
ncbi:SdiA-regulated domain-containing protein [Flexithrix dorotheae]|uniref:SdiA-regulated domain-containing protein n=1 Tax=Flexithrix dorotheae TaxID=70993 RepID=UPI00039FA244|nr:SdiA-regulated domain-containing protein [Flexithrix dorotheae]